MLKFMGRENTEDYNADFLILLEAWEAAERFLYRGTAAVKPKAFDAARLLGWTRPDTSRPGAAERASDAANACASASELLQGGYFKRSELAGLTVHDARNVLDGVISQHRTIEKSAKIAGHTAQEVANAKRIVAKAGVATFDDIREGRVAKRDVRGTVDVHAYRLGKEANRQTPLFEVFAKSLTSQIERVAAADSISEKLHEIVNALGSIQMAEDVETVKRVSFECGEAAERFSNWERKLANPKKRVVPLKQIEGRS
jgi:hypothetical protein